MQKGTSENGETQYIEFKVGPFTMKFGGRELFNIIITLMALGFITYVVHEHDKHQEIVLTNAVTSLHDNTDTLNVLIYVNSLPVEDRAKLNLQKPDKLKKMEKQ